MNNCLLQYFRLHKFIFPRIMATYCNTKKYKLHIILHDTQISSLNLPSKYKSQIINRVRTKTDERIYKAQNNSHVWCNVEMQMPVQGTTKSPEFKVRTSGWQNSGNKSTILPLHHPNWWQRFVLKMITHIQKNEYMFMGGVKLKFRVFQITAVGVENVTLLVSRIRTKYMSFFHQTLETVSLEGCFWCFCKGWKYRPPASN